MTDPTPTTPPAPARQVAVPPPSAGDLRRDLAADLALCDAATPEPWEAQCWPDGSGFTPRHHYGKLMGPRMTHGAVLMLGADAEFCAAARTGWPAALRRLAVAETERDRLRDDLEAMGERLAKAAEALGGPTERAAAQGLGDRAAELRRVQEVVTL